jgi:hypothetical protein
VKIDQEHAIAMRDVLHRSRRGLATSAEIERTLDLAALGGLDAVYLELRRHKDRAAAERQKTTGRDVLVGVISGLATHLLLGHLLKGESPWRTT